jgi:plasmid stabilization system protein ParE
MALEIEWTETAENQLDGIIEYLEANWTIKEIKHFFKNLEKAIQTIGNRPKQQKKSLRKDGAYEYQLTSQVTIFYTFDTEKATILLLWSNRMNPDNL